MIRRHWLILLGLGIAVIGVLILVLARADEFGWTSYASLSTAPNFLVFEGVQALFGLLLLVVGAGTAGAGIGHAMSRAPLIRPPEDAS